MALDQFAVRRELAIELARQAGELLVKRDGVESVSTKSSATDIVTAVDHAAEALIVSHVTQLHPEDGILAEEGSGKPSGSGFVWIIDPLDGTANYVRNLRSSAVSIAIAFHDVVRVGVVYDPYAGELYAGELGRGATLNGRALRVEHDGNLRKSFVGLSGSNREPALSKRLSLFQRLVRAADSVRDTGSTALSLCWTAAGRFDAHIGLDVAWWDMAAGVVIAREAGCETTDFEGNANPTPEGFAVAPPLLMESLRDALG